MAIKKIVDSTQLDANLASVADAIRAKSGGSADLAFPSGFVSEIQTISADAGGGEQNAVWIDRELAEETSSYYVYQLEKTQDEIMAYVNSGKVVFVQHPNGVGYGRFACVAGSVGYGPYLCLYTDGGTAASGGNVTLDSTVYVNAKAEWVWPGSGASYTKPRRTIVKGGSND